MLPLDLNDQKMEMKELNVSLRNGENWVREKRPSTLIPLQSLDAFHPGLLKLYSCRYYGNKR